MPADEVLNRWLAALANEGARLLDEKIALRPSDIDHLMVAGYHFPRWRGGPMYQATQRGLMVLRRDLRVWAVDGPLWTPAPLIDRLIRDGRTFASLDN
jgi:3-hydroxyacyl-CoA dehydrogenase